MDYFLPTIMHRARYVRAILAIAAAVLLGWAS
jgi:hypothetical protein